MSRRRSTFEPAPRRLVEVAGAGAALLAITWLPVALAAVGSWVIR